ncbi:MAG TPA: PilZ domain-containing protein [Treponemataceae bacterium]|nr:PilZ domain-containing protein [Treponemataceae bacterium]
MPKKFRKDTRYEKYGRIAAQSICVFQGVILDISLKGCRVRFPALLSPDTETDYELVLSFSERDAPDSLILLAHIQWVEKGTDSTEIGFCFFHSPDTKKLASFIEQLSFDYEETLCPK